MRQVERQQVVKAEQEVRRQEKVAMKVAVMREQEWVHAEREAVKAQKQCKREAVKANKPNHPGKHHSLVLQCSTVHCHLI